MHGKSAKWSFTLSYFLLISVVSRGKFSKISITHVIVMVHFINPDRRDDHGLVKLFKKYKMFGQTVSWIKINYLYKHWLKIILFITCFSVYGVKYRYFIN